MSSVLPSLLLYRDFYQLSEIKTTNRGYLLSGMGMDLLGIPLALWCGLGCHVAITGCQHLHPSSQPHIHLILLLSLKNCPRALKSSHNLLLNLDIATFQQNKLYSIVCIYLILTEIPYMINFQGGKLSWLLWIFANHDFFTIESFP